MLADEAGPTSRLGTGEAWRVWRAVL